MGNIAALDGVDSDGLAAVRKTKSMEIGASKAVQHFFPSATFVQVYFEAVANALDAQATLVTIHIVTDPLRITITDNGEGFTNDRFDRFCRLLEPKDKYHKGLGRLVYLRWFSRVDVKSVFADKKRTFTFSDPFNSKADAVGADPSDRLGTTLWFSGYERGRHPVKDDLSPEILKTRILEHFLPRLYKIKESGQTFRIDIELEDSRTSTMVSNLASLTDSDVPEFDSVIIQDAHPQIDTFGAADIRMLYAFRTGAGQSLTAACIDERTIPLNLISPGAIPADRVATFLFESEMFTGRADSARQRLVLQPPLSEETLFPVLRREISRVLFDKFPDIGIANEVTRQHLEATYPHFYGLFDNETVGLVDREQALEIAQRRFFKQQRDVLESTSLDDATYEKSLEAASRTLTEYILYRQFIIKRLSATSKRDDESVVHDIIVPRHNQFHGKDLVDGIYRNNAWLLDDRFMSFQTILSESTMAEVTAALSKDNVSLSQGRPDIAMIFSADPEQQDKVDAVVVEVKKRFAPDRENFWVEAQLLDRAEILANYWPRLQRVWYFAIIDIDEAAARRLVNRKWTPLFSRGRVFYQDFSVTRPDGTSVLAPITIVSYDAVIEDAAARNRTFLEILKDTFKKAKPAAP